MNKSILQSIESDYGVRLNESTPSSPGREVIGTEDLSRILRDSFEPPKETKELLELWESMICQINDSGFNCIETIDVGLLMVARVYKNKSSEIFMRLYIEKGGWVRLAQVPGAPFFSIKIPSCKNPNEAIKAIVHIIESEIGDA